MSISSIGSHSAYVPLPRQAPVANPAAAAAVGVDKDNDGDSK